MCTELLRVHRGERLSGLGESGPSSRGVGKDVHANLAEREVKAGQAKGLHVPKRAEELGMAEEEPGGGEDEARKL